MPLKPFVPTMPLRPSTVAALALVALVSAYAPYGTAVAEEGAAAKAAAELVPEEAGGVPPAGATPATDTSPAPTAEPTQTSDACKKILADLGSGDLKALDSLPARRRADLLGSPSGVRLITCLAVADDNNKLCDKLPDKSKGECRQDCDLLREMKAQPKEALKAKLIHRLCVQGSPAAECDKIQAAMIARDPGKCKDLSKASFRTFCEALASGDAKKCDSLPQSESEGPSRSVCAAYASEDPKHCPQDSPDCIKLTETFATLGKQGLEGFSKSDPALAAARTGKAACAPLVADLAKLCEETK